MAFLYTDTREEIEVTVSLGDQIVAEDWAEAAYPEDLAKQMRRRGFYSLYLAAKRESGPHTGGSFEDFLAFVFFEPDAEPAPETEPGEPDAPPTEP